MSNHLPEIFVIAHNIRSLYNVGSLFRLCDGAGVTKLYLTGLTGTPADTLRNQRQRQQIAKTALEGLEAVSWEYRQDVLSLIHELQSKNVVIMALEQTPTSLSYDQADYHAPLCLVLGHEADGLDTDTLAAVDSAIELPMYGRGKSLNVISAASIALYHIRLSAS